MSTLGPDIGAALALRHIEEAARNAEPNEPLVVTIMRARDTLWQEIERTKPRDTDPGGLLLRRER